MLIDTHIHSVFSGHAALKVQEIVRFCKKNGIVPALTDHDTTAGWNSFAEKAKEAGIPFILGEEIHVFDGKRCIGEVLGLFMQEPVKPGNFGEVIDALRDQGALVSAAHPFDRFRKALFVRALDKEQVVRKVDAIEVFNSRAYLGRFNRKAEGFAKAHSIPFTAGSDAHFSIELGNAWLETDADSLEAARKNILKKKCSFHGTLSPKRVHVYTQLAKLGFFK